MQYYPFLTIPRGFLTLIPARKEPDLPAADLLPLLSTFRNVSTGMYWMEGFYLLSEPVRWQSLSIPQSLLNANPKVTQTMFLPLPQILGRNITDYTDAYVAHKC